MSIIYPHSHKIRNDLSQGSRFKFLVPIDTLVKATGHINPDMLTIYIKFYKITSRHQKDIIFMTVLEDRDLPLYEIANYVDAMAANIPNGQIAER